ncbi:gamma-glutamyltransferase family protein [Leucobacter chromiireducens]|uniref:Gamma-glutamyltranspeptidase n=1 Tax=Leucobacter chromiireducens subsp. solipictus TaxID=398235 RepID=A0ABS1SE21_9MICO|nr:gamma-glutamyltransferase [Leucobacter chromiireducens]MBL3678606.1 gamma-glutamyltranspeptidase [Leucobacter chromiireducens subsp. solipictus]
MVEHTHATGGAISTSHHLATEAGAAALRAGGNAIDAALAAAATLCVVYPNNVALGGDLVALVRSPEGEIRFLNATGAAPAGQTLEALREKHGDALPLRGIDTVTVPGGICGWNSLHEYGATRPWAAHFEHAIRHAEQGIANSKSVAAALIEDQATFAQDPGARDVFYPGGEPLAEGAPLVQPALARTLRRIAAGGSAEFYEGETADRWIAGLQALGSKITKQDAIDYQGYWADPLEGEFEGYRVVTGPPNTSGFMLLRALEAVATGIEDPLGTGAGELALAFHHANSLRASHLADPRHGGATGQELVKLPAPEWPVPAAAKASGDTVGFAAISDDGWAVSFINSVYWSFGAHIVEPETGILFQNRGTSFALDPASPNAFAPGKRPRHTLMPVLILRGDEIAWVPATMGGAAQPQIHAQLLLRSLAGATPHEATHAPRWMVEEWPGNGPATVMAEADVPVEAQRAIAAAGFPLTVVPPVTEDLGHSNLIRVTPTGYEAASDPRSDGSAVIVQAPS